MLPEALVRARAILESVTPLKTDCGLLCQGLCCRPMEGENTGMMFKMSDSVEAAEEEAASSPQPTIRVERASAISNMHTVSFFIFDLLKIFIVRFSPNKAYYILFFHL